MRISDWSSDVCSSDLGDCAISPYRTAIITELLKAVADLDVKILTPRHPGESSPIGDDRFKALLQRLAAVRGRLSLCADQAAAAKWWLSMPMASVSAEGPMPKALSTRRTSPLMPGCRHQGRACPLRRSRMTSNPLIVA